MKYKFTVIYSFRIFLYLLFILFSVECSIKPQQTPKTMQGRIFVTGNEPFTHLAIEVPSGKVYLISKDSPDYPVLWKLQGKVVEVKFKFLTKDQTQTIFVEKFQLIKK